MHAVEYLFKIRLNDDKIMLTVSGEEVNFTSDEGTPVIRPRHIKLAADLIARMKEEIRK